MSEAKRKLKKSFWEIYAEKYRQTKDKYAGWKETKNTTSG